jgi:lipoprotein-anchoring transpeptidase ErfK/SrfK
MKLSASPRLPVRLALSLVALARVAWADTGLPPWTDPDDVPLPDGARTVAPRRAEVPIFTQPGKVDARRGSAVGGARLPLYAAKRGPQCAGRWLMVGPAAWVCSDHVDLTGDPPTDAVDFSRTAADGLPYRYFFVGKDGAYGYARLGDETDGQPEQELDPGFGVAVVEERRHAGEAWGRTARGRWIALRELGPAHPSGFHGEEIAGGDLDVAWVSADKATVFASAKADKASGTKLRFQKVAWRESVPSAQGLMVRISADGATPTEWMRARDLAHPTVAAPPAEVGGAAARERWIDVELATQTLVAYEGAVPVFATLVSTGKGPPGSDTATPPGVHRVWVKLVSTNMDNLEKDDVDRHYSIEDVPWVMFFDKAVALHGTFWHRDFGRVRSHGCVNLAPLDARRIFEWTAPHLPRGWSAALPTPLEPGTAVRVR